jgi:thioredoxin reductase/SAM-dependent methyltransferase
MADHTTNDEHAHHEADGEVVDVVVIGGGAAGLSAALNLGRVRRSVVVVDAGQPRNAPAAHMHGYLGHEGLPPLELLRAGRTEVERYGVRLVEGEAARTTGDAIRGFTVELTDGRLLHGRHVLVTTGLVDELPAIDGLAERWGRDVVHCPFCHGWEVRDRPIVVVGTNGGGTHAAQVFHTLSDDITVVVHDGVGPSPADAAALTALGIAVRTGPVAEVVVTDDAVTGVRLVDGTVVPAEAVVVRGRMVARSSVLISLGLEAVEGPMGVTIEADPMGATATPGVWVAGNVTDLAANVVMSAASGARTAGAIHAALLATEISAATTKDEHAHHDHGGAGHNHDHGAGHDHGDGHGPGPDTVLDRAFWESWYAEREQVWTGDPNPALVAEADGLTPGRALDIGAGEGGDAIWLARRGWTVTAVDIAETACERGRRAAEAEGAEIAARVTWQAADVVTWAPPARAFDLVAVHYVHLTADERATAYAACAEAVAPGGTLLIVGHHPGDMDDAAGRWGDDRFFTAEQVADELDDGWELVAVEARPRPHRDPDGVERTIRDTVLVARRR